MSITLAVCGRRRAYPGARPRCSPQRTKGTRRIRAGCCAVHDG